MISNDDFYRRDRQRQREREPLNVDLSTAIQSPGQNVVGGEPLNVPNNTVQERRHSMPQRSFTGGFLATTLPPSSAPAPEKSAASPVVASPVNKDSNIGKPTEKATDPRKRLDRNSPSIQPTASFPNRISSPLSNDKSKKFERSSALNRVPSAVSSPVPSDDVEMVDASDPSPSDELARALIQFGEEAVAAGLRKLQKSQTREEYDEAVKEHHKARESFKSYPPLLEQTESKRKAADQNYKIISKKLLQSTQSRDSKAGLLANILHSQLEQASAHASKASEDESNTWRTELKPWTNRLEKLEEGVQAQTPAVGTQELLQSLEPRLQAFKSSVPFDQKHVIQTEVKKLQEEDRKKGQLLQHDIKDLFVRTQAISTDLDKVQDDCHKATKPLEDDIRWLLKCAKDNKCDVGNLRKDNRDVVQLTKEDIHLLFNRDADRTAEIAHLRQENSDIWTAFAALREQSATQPEVEVLKRELKIYRDERVSKAEFERICKIVKDLQNPASKIMNSSIQAQDPTTSNQILVNTALASAQNIPGMLAQSELDSALARIDQLETEVSALSKSGVTDVTNEEQAKDPFAESSTLQHYVERYQQDMSRVNAKMALVEQYKTDYSQKLDEYQTDITNQVRALDGRVDTVESKISTQQAEIVLIQQNQDKPSSGPGSSEAPGVNIGAGTSHIELRSTAGSHAQKITQLQVQLNHVVQTLHGVQGSSQGGVSQAWAEATNQTIKELQQMVGPLAYDVGNVQKLAASSEHSIRALTSRYNNLSSEQFSKRMANHLNPLPATLQVEHNNMKLRIDALQTQHNELSKTVESAEESASKDDTHSAAEESRWQEFEQRLKHKYYDVLEVKTQQARQEIDQTLEGTQSDQNVMKADLEALQNRMDELESNTLLNSFQRPAKQKPSPPPEISIHGRSERSASRANSQRPLADRIEHPDVLGGSGKRRPYEDFEEPVTVARPPSSPRKKAKWAK